MICKKIVLSLFAAVIFSQTSVFAEQSTMSQSFSFSTLGRHGGDAALDRNTWESEFRLNVRQLVRSIGGIESTALFGRQFIESNKVYLYLDGAITRRFPHFQPSHIFEKVPAYTSAYLDISPGECGYYHYPRISKGFMEDILQDLVDGGFIKDFEIYMIRDRDCSSNVSIGVGAMEVRLWY